MLANVNLIYNKLVCYLLPQKTCIRQKGSHKNHGWLQIHLENKTSLAYLTRMTATSLGRWMTLGPGPRQVPRSNPPRPSSCPFSSSSTRTCFQTPRQKWCNLMKKWRAAENGDTRESWVVLLSWRYWCAYFNDVIDTALLWLPSAQNVSPPSGAEVVHEDGRTELLTAGDIETSIKSAVAESICQNTQREKSKSRRSSRSSSRCPTATPAG